MKKNDSLVILVIKFGSSFVVDFVDVKFYLVVEGEFVCLLLIFVWIV